MNKFWRPQPKEPWSDWRTYSMLLPIGVSVLGFFVSGIFAFAFSDIDVIRDDVQSWMVILSSALIVLGAEANTPGTVIEAFRKILREEHNSWDISALVLSLVGTVFNLLITFASRTKLDPAWRSVLLNWGPLVSGFAVACDYYGGLVETGFLFGSFELRTERWLVERREWQAAETQRNQEPRPARVADFRRIVARRNGAGPMNVEQLESELERDNLLVPSPGTVRRWLKMGVE